MTQTAARQHARSYWLRILLSVAALIAAFLILTCVRILHAASQQELLSRAHGIQSAALLPPRAGGSVSAKENCQLKIAD